MEGVAYKIKDVFRGMVFTTDGGIDSSIRTRLSRDGSKMFPKRSYELGHTKLFRFTGPRITGLVTQVATLITSIPEEYRGRG